MRNAAQVNELELHPMEIHRHKRLVGVPHVIYLCNQDYALTDGSWVTASYAWPLALSTHTHNHQEVER